MSKVLFLLIKYFNLRQNLFESLVVFKADWILVICSIYTVHISSLGLCLLIFDTSIVVWYGQPKDFSTDLHPPSRRPIHAAESSLSSGRTFCQLLKFRLQNVKLVLSRVRCRTWNAFDPRRADRHGPLTKYTQRIGSMLCILLKRQVHKRCTTGKDVVSLVSASVYAIHYYPHQFMAYNSILTSLWNTTVSSPVYGIQQYPHQFVAYNSIRTSVLYALVSASV